MKTISIQTDLMRRFEDSQMMDGVRATRTMPTWLPVPPARSNFAAAQAKSKQTNSIWIPLENDSLGEKLMGGLLVVAGVASISYGFSFLLDVVQNWSGLTSWVAQIL